MVNQKWTYHSTLTSVRDFSVAITMKDGVYIFGGWSNPLTSDFLPNGSKDYSCKELLLPTFIVNKMIYNEIFSGFSGSLQRTNFSLRRIYHNYAAIQKLYVSTYFR